MVVALRADARARRFTLSLDPAGGAPRLTLPPTVPASEARMFLLRQSDWLRGALSRAPEQVRVGIGAALPLRGRMLTVEADGRRRGAPVARGEALETPVGSGEVGARIAAFLREEARADLAAAVRRHAAALGREPGRLTLRDMRTRWGSCAARGDMAFSWRLVMAPAEVLDYVAAHEVAHLAEMNHSPAFWRVLERLLPDWRAHRDWLRAEGAGLHRYRFS